MRGSLFPIVRESTRYREWKPGVQISKYAVHNHSSARTACEHPTVRVYCPTVMPLPLSFCLATIHHSSNDTPDQACPAPAIYTAHSCPGPAVPCRATACPYRPSPWALERGSREMKGRRQLSVNTIPHNIQQPQHGVRFFPCDSAQMVVGRVGLIPDTQVRSRVALL